MKKVLPREEFELRSLKKRGKRREKGKKKGLPKKRKTQAVHHIFVLLGPGSRICYAGEGPLCTGSKVPMEI